jgi:predicted DNA-binding transcriptional regulator AlpA
MSKQSSATELLTSADVARQLKVSMATLSRWRLFKTGPRFVKLGNIPRYRQEDVDQYIEDSIQ